MLRVSQLESNAMGSLKILQPITNQESRPGDQAGNRVAKDLSENIRGEVRFDNGSRALYATDGSNYRQVPVGVVLPRDLDDVVNTVAICRHHHVPLVNRGGGTSLCGQGCNVAVVMDFSKYMHHVLDVDPRSKTARVQPGVILDSLRNAAQLHRITFGPDPATHDHCTLGGMLGNNSCGIHSQYAGKTAENTEELDVLTYRGLQFKAGWMTEHDLEVEIRGGGEKGELFHCVRDLRDRYADLIRKRYPNIPRRVSGYNLDELLPNADGRFNLARALVGSESTLVTILEAKLNLVQWFPVRTLVVLGYPDIYQAADHLEDIEPFNNIFIY
jgi:FAD/FMN-containing dehydrogenase